VRAGEANVWLVVEEDADRSQELLWPGGVDLVSSIDRLVATALDQGDKLSDVLTRQEATGSAAYRQCRR
jgi:hypothetical protein